MKQIISFEKIKKGGKFSSLKVVESSEVDPGVFMELNEEKYDLDQIAKASEQGIKVFTQLIRQKNFFPSTDLCNKLFENSIDFFKNKSEKKIVVKYNDIDVFAKEDFQLEDDDVKLDEILDDDDIDVDKIKEIDDPIIENDTPKFKPDDTSEHEN